jgi:hypothetical protein
LADPIEQTTSSGGFEKRLRAIVYLQSLAHADPPAFDGLPAAVGGRTGAHRLTILLKSCGMVLPQ